MLGKEVYETYVQDYLKQKNDSFKEFSFKKIEIEENLNITIISTFGDIIEIHPIDFQLKEKIIAIVDIWLNLITRYKIVSEGVYLDPAIYWDIYKNKPFGRIILNNIGYTMTINKEEC